MLYGKILVRRNLTLGLTSFVIYARGRFWVFTIRAKFIPANCHWSELAAKTASILR